MTAILLSSTPVINQEIERFKSICLEMKEKSRAPKMAVILVGNNSASQIYVRNKKAFCGKIGADCQIIELNENISQNNFLEQVSQVTSDRNIDGVIVQLPLPKQLESINLGKLIPADKDIDGFNLENLYQLYQGKLSGVYPCTPKGIIKLLDYYNIPISGKNITIIGRGMLVGKPLFHLLTNMNATVTLCHSNSNICKHVENADIIVLAAGCCDLITCSNFNPKNPPVIIDVGINVTNGKLTGDCNYKKLLLKCSAITPVPKGVGPMTIWGLIDNLLTLARNNR